MVRTLRRRLADGRTRKLIATIFAGKMLGVIAVLFVVNQIVGLIDTPASAQTVTHQANDLVNPDQHGLGAGHRLPRVLHAGGLHDARGRLRPVPGDRERPHGVHRRHVPVRAPVLGVRLRVHVRRGQRLDRPPVLLPAGRAGHLRLDGAWRSWRSSCSSSRSPTPARRSPRAPWSAARASRATCSTRRRHRLHLPDLRPLGLGPGRLARHHDTRLRSTRFTGGTVFRDFAGSTVVHTVGGVIALAGAIALGPRLGRKFKRDGGGPLAAARHDDRRDRRRDPVVRLVRVQPRLHALGAWTSRASAGSRPTRPSRRAPAGWSAMFWVYPRSKKWDLGMSVNGFLGGLVAITCPCYWVSPAGAVIIGGDRRHRRPARRRLHRVDPGRRPDRRGRGPRLRRHLGHAEPRPVRHGRVRRADARTASTRPPR